MRMWIGAALGAAAMLGAGALAPGTARAQAQSSWGTGYGVFNPQDGRDAFARGYRQGRMDERRDRERQARMSPPENWRSGEGVPTFAGRPYGAYGYERFEEGWLGDGRLTW